MFCDLLYCADCGSKLWFNIKHNKTDILFFSCVNYHGNRGTCKSTHYLRADAIEAIVMHELRKMCRLFQYDEEAFANILAEKTNKDIAVQKKQYEDTLQKFFARSEMLVKLYEKLYEDNVSGKVTDEWFMQLSHKYEVERFELKNKISDLRKQLDELDSVRQGKESFTAAIRKFMQMERLTAPLLRELIDHIDVYVVEGTGKNKTQRIVIYYRFVGYIDLSEYLPQNNFREETRTGVEIEYISNTKSA